MNLDSPASRDSSATHPVASADAADAPTAANLGFGGNPQDGWSKSLRGELWHFRSLRTLADLRAVDDLQREVFGVGDYDLIPANEYLVVSETGGEIIGAFPQAADSLAGAVVGWGGFVAGRPRIVSDFLGVRPAFRNAGLGAELKRLQAVHALATGFVEIVWTVDPLRAANARVNFEKLGATADRYEIDRYGADFATGLYGGLPTDRLHVTWSITDARVQARLRGNPAAGWHAVATVPIDPAPVPVYAPGTSAACVTVAIPPDIDRLLASDPAAAHLWRLRVREQLQRAFAERLRVVGFTAAGETGAALVLKRDRDG